MAQDMPEFEDFELLIGAAREPGVYPITVTQSPAGRASSTLALNPNTPQVQSALDAIASRRTSDDLLIQFGRNLFEALMSDPIEDVYRKSQGTDKRLRLRLCIEPPELSALPWEYLYDPASDLSLAISNKHCLSRYILVNEKVPTLEIQPPLRVLIVVSDPSDLSDYEMPALNASEEINRIKSALQKLEGAGQVKLQVLAHAVGPDLRELLRTYSPHVIHFIGHGGFQNDQGMLIMEDEDHRVRFVSDRQFREFFLEADNVKLVILNACQGATQSSTKALAGLAPQIVRRGLGAVIAMQYPIPDQVSLSFAREFYRAIVQYYPVDTAVAEARRAVYQDFGSDKPDWGTPVLFMRSPDGKLFGSPEKKPVTTPVQTKLVTSAIESGSKESTMPTVDSNQYDVFISYSHHDKAWVQSWLLPNLERAKIHVCIDFRDFEPGAPSITEMERAVTQSRKTLLVLTPDYLNSVWTEFENIMAQSTDPGARQRRLLPLMFKPCELPLRIRTLTFIDFTQSDQADFQFNRLLKAIGSESPSTNTPVTPMAGVPTQTASSSESIQVPSNPVDLYKFIDKRFKLEELRNLCFSLRVDYENLGGEGKSGKARELVAHMQRRGRLAELIEAVQHALAESEMD